MGVEFTIKKPTYLTVLTWIADFDEPDSGDGPGEIAEYRTCYMMADLFGVERSRVGQDVYNLRVKKGLVKP